MMRGTGGTMVYIKGDPKIFKGILVHPVVLVNDLLGRYSFLPGFYGDRYAVFIGAANKNNVFSLQPQIPGINICRNVNTCQVPDMDRSVGIWQGGCNEVAFEFIHFVIDRLGQGA